MKLLSGLGNLAGALLMTCLGGLAALVKTPSKRTNYSDPKVTADPTH